MSSNNSSIPSDYADIDWDALTYSMYFIYSLAILLAAIFNTWMLAALMTSPEMRLTMRNRLICLILFNNLIRAVVVILLELIEFALAVDASVMISCGYGTFVRVIRFSLMWVENWYVLIFMVHYISTQLEFDPVKYISDKNIRIGTWLILSGPWVLSFIVGPSVLLHHHIEAHGVHSDGCAYYTLGAHKALTNFGVVAPWFLKFGLMVIVLVLNYRRKTRYSTMNSSLIGPNTHIDDVKAYVVLYVIVAVTQLLFVIEFLGIVALPNFSTRLVYNIMMWYISETRGVIIPAAFLFFEDIRYRMKTWRPWYRPAPGIDLTVSYNQSKEDSGN